MHMAIEKIHTHSYIFASLQVIIMNEIIVKYLTISKHTSSKHKHRHQEFDTRWPGLLSDAVKPLRYILWPVWPLRGINKTVWGTKLILRLG